MSSTENYPEKYLEGIACFNRGDYFECHELLESLWLETGGTEGLFYQAVIQAAVALYHLQGQNLFGALSLEKAAMDKFAQVPSPFMGMDIALFCEDFRKCLEPFQSLKPGDPVQIDASRLPKIELHS